MPTTRRQADKGRVQSLPQEVIELIFVAIAKTPSSSLKHDKACLALAMTCRILNKAFREGGTAVQCKQRSLARLLEAKVIQDYQDAFRSKCLVLVLQPPKTLRLVRWLETKYVTMQDFWEYGQVNVTRRRQIESYKLLKIVFKEKLPESSVLTKREIRFLKHHVKILQNSVGTPRLVAWHDSSNKMKKVLLRGNLTDYC